MLAFKAICRQVKNPGFRTYTHNKIIIPSQVEPINPPQLNLDQFLWRNFNKWCNRTAIECSETGRQLTYEQLRFKSDRLAKWLMTRSGLHPGNVAAIVMINIPDYYIALLACIQAGLITTTLNPNYTPEEAAKQLNNSCAQLLFTQSQLLPGLSKAVSLTKQKINHIILAEDGESHPNGTLKIEELYNCTESDRKPNERQWEDLVILPYSSGTTGTPKGVCLSHRNIVSNLYQMQAEHYKLHEETTSDHQDVIPVILPMYHAYALVVISLNLLSEGCKLVLLPKYRPDKFFELLKKHKPNLIHVAPPLVHVLCDSNSYDRTLLERTRHVLCAAAPLAAEDTARFLDKYGSNISIRQAYGLTETSPLTHIQRTDRTPIPGGAGWCVPGTQCRIVNSEGIDQTTGNVGEILIYGPQVMMGYFNNLEATTNTIKDGWLHTGDIGYYDETGHFFVTDRLKELIKVKGFQVAPAELEALLRDHPGIRDAAVVGVLDRKDGEKPLAFVVPRENKNSDVLARDIIEYVASKTARHKHLTAGVRFIDAIPRNPSGKILRRQLKQILDS